MKSEFDYVSLGQRIRKARKLKGITQEKLAEECNLSTAHIGHIERGTRALSIESLVVISNALNISTDYLLMNISHKDDSSIEDIISATKHIDKHKYNKLCSITKILAENIDKL